MERKTRQNELAKKIVRMVIYMSAFLGIVTLLIQAMTVNDAVNYWGNMWNIPLKGNQHQIHFILTIVIMLIWSIITIYNGASNNVWKIFFLYGILLLKNEYDKIKKKQRSDIFENY